MLRRLTLALALAAGLCFTAVPASAAAPAVNLVADPDFATVTPGARTGVWECDPRASVVDLDGDGGSEFTQHPFIGPRDGDGLATEPPQVPRYALTGGSGEGCIQTIPVQPGARYQLSMIATGAVALGTEYGTVPNPAGLNSQAITTAFTAGSAATTVTVRVRGTASGGYTARRVALTGPASAVRAPGSPTSLLVDRHTTRSLWLGWTGSPGASNYAVYADGRPVVSTAATSAVLTLTRGQDVVLRVVASNPAGSSPASAEVAAVAVRVWDTPPAAPAQPSVKQLPGGTRLGIGATERETDGYYVYSNGVRIGWTYSGSGMLPPLGGGQHTITMTALNAAGESAPSAPVEADDGNSES